MRCNYDCRGCYSRGRPTEDELSTKELDELLGEAEKYGVLAVVVTGGEPLLRNDLIPLFGMHKRLLFVLISNGSLMTGDSARRLAASGNVVTLVSMEGTEWDTDERRRDGAHGAVLKAFDVLRSVGACFGFAAVVTTRNLGSLRSDSFLDEMISHGCAIGYFTEYVPCGESPNPDWVLRGETASGFRSDVLALRKRKPLIIVHFPYDEYGPDNRCTGAGKMSLHINSQGGVEPCPFVSVSMESIRDGGLVTAFRSDLLRSIREHPPLLTRKTLACAMFENREMLHRLVQTSALSSEEGWVRAGCRRACEIGGEDGESRRSE
jgi:MoaA/NifB/PqqE/SkfB family radical SAM enzyme